MPACLVEPVRFAVMIQSWFDLSFLHWRFPVAAIARLVPPPLEVESFDGSAWVGVTPFVLRGLRLPHAPALPWLSDFPETNCRTYVRGPGGRRGIWFFSLDAARGAAVAGARLAYGLPYAWSKMRVRKSENRVQYESKRRWPDRGATSRIEVEYSGPLSCGALENFLTARFTLFTFIAGRLCYANVEHAPWPLHSATAIAVEQTLTRCAGLPDPPAPPVAYFSEGVTVRVGPPRTV